MKYKQSSENATRKKKRNEKELSETRRNGNSQNKTKKHIQINIFIWERTKKQKQ